MVYIKFHCRKHLEKLIFEKPKHLKEQRKLTKRKTFFIIILSVLKKVFILFKFSFFFLKNNINFIRGLFAMCVT